MAYRKKNITTSLCDSDDGEDIYLEEESEEESAPLSGAEESDEESEDEIIPPPPPRPAPQQRKRATQTTTAKKQAPKTTTKTPAKKPTTKAPTTKKTPAKKVTPVTPPEKQPVKKTPKKKSQPQKEPESEKESTGPKTRCFFIVLDSVNPPINADKLSQKGGRFTGKIPNQAARKAFGKIAKVHYDDPALSKKPCIYTFSIQERKKEEEGKKPSIFSYEGNMIKLETPRIVERGGTKYEVWRDPKVRSLRGKNKVTTPTN